MWNLGFQYLQTEVEFTQYISYPVYIRGQMNVDWCETMQGGQHNDQWFILDTLANQTPMQVDNHRYNMLVFSLVCYQSGYQISHHLQHVHECLYSIMSNCYDCSAFTLNPWQEETVGWTDLSVLSRRQLAGLTFLYSAGDSWLD